MLRERVESTQCASCMSGRKNLKRSAELDALDAGHDAARGRTSGTGSAKRLRSARGTPHLTVVIRPRISLSVSHHAKFARFH